MARYFDIFYLDIIPACCYTGRMTTTNVKTTFYTTPALQKALKRRALEADQTISAYIHQAIVNAIAEDLSDIQVFDDRSNGSTETLEDFLANVKADGLV